MKFHGKGTIYYVVCETVSDIGDVKDWFECFSSDDRSEAIRWAERHVLDYVASEDEQLTVLAVPEGSHLYSDYDEHDIIWCSQ